jgi:hypothetical protein
MDAAASTLAEACRPLLDQALPDEAVRRQVFAQVGVTAPNGKNCTTF